MELKNYLNLCDKSNKVLLNKSYDYLIKSITKLYILKPHPSLLVFYNKFGLLNYIQIKYKKIIKYFYNLITNSLKINNNKKFTKKNTLIISHLINESHLKKKNDFYFGDIQNKLNQKTISSLILYRNFSDISSSKLNKYKKNNKFILSETCQIFLEFYFIFQVLKTYLKFSIFQGHKREINKLLSFKDFFSIMNNLRLSYQVIKIIKLCSIKNIIFTYEGHAWERNLIYSLRSFDKDLKIFAYQFSILTKYSFSIFQKLGKKFDPDYILTSGSYTKKKFIKKKFNESKILILGSNKSKYTKKRPLNKKIKNVIITPENFNSEIEILFKFSIKLALNFKEINFIYRVHPQSKNISYLRKFHIPKNFKFSNSNLDKNLKICDLIIYRGSATCIEAVSQGLIPIYLSLRKEVNFDPLYEVSPKIFTVSSASDFQRILNNYKICNKHLIKLQKYCKEFFTPLKLNNIVNKLNR